MTEDEVKAVLDEERMRQSTINGNNKMIESLRNKLSISSSANINERVQGSGNYEPTFVVVTDLICSLELEIAYLTIGSIKYIELIASTRLDAIDRTIIESYYGNNLSLRQTARIVEDTHYLLFDHKRITREINKIIKKLACPKSPSDM